jgi:hypothetical protein
VHRQTRIRPRAIVWGLVVAACLIVGMAGSGMAAQEPNPEPLWNAYPLDDQGSSGSAGQNASTTTTPTQPAASPAATTTQAQVTVTDEAGDDPPWALMVAAAAGGAMFVVLLLMLQGRRARGRDEGPLVGPADEWPWLTSKANGEAREFRAERLRNAPRTPTANGLGGERGADVAASARAAERGQESERELAADSVPSGAAAEPEQERAVEPVSNGPVVEPSAEPEQERAVEPAPNGAAAEPAGESGEERIAEPAPNGAAAEPSAEPEQERAAEASSGAAAEPLAEPEPERVAEREPAANGAVAEPASSPFDVVEADAVPRHRFDREAEAPNGRPTPARRGPICQVRWSAPGMCFYAATTDVNGVEHRLAWSPPIEWRESGPPDEDSREARAAVRVLAKDLRDKGWRPMRAKGDDFDEQRWYARRFRFPVAAGDDDVAPWQHGPPAAASHGEV